MKKNIKISMVLLSTAILSGCGIFPKEEELAKTPIIEAYEQEPFRMVKVQRGTLKLYEKLEPVCMNIGEKQYTFQVSDMAFKGIYVTLGEQIKKGTLLAELVGDETNSQVASANQLKLTAEEDCTVTFVKAPEDGEKSISGQIIVTTNTTKGYYMNAFTKNWKRFKKGQQVVIRIAGKEYKATVIEAEDIGLSKTVRPTDKEEASEVYFHLEDQSAYLQSGDKGEITILVEEKENVLYIPKSSVTLVNDKKIVYVENEDGIRSVKYIETGLETGKEVEVTSGLEEGDSIIVE